MKIALITDQHFGARNDSILFLDYYEKFYRETFFPKLKEENIKHVLILGDTFDRRKYINFHTLQRAKQMFFDILYEENILVYMLAGNHDTYFKNTNDVNSIDLLLREYDNILVIDRPQTIHFLKENPSTDFLMIPWICVDNYQQCIDEINNSTASLCAGHFEIAGFSMYRGQPALEGLQRDIFRKFEYTFSGHYHHKSSSDSIYYLGNPYGLTWQDYNDSRGFHVFDLDTRNLDFIENPNVMFHRIIYDDKLNTFEEINALDVSKYANTYVKIVVVNKTNPYIFDTFIDKLYSVGPADLNIVEDFTDFSEGIDEDILDQAEDTISLLNKYVDSIKEESINNDKLKNILRELYVEAVNIQ